MWDNKFLIILTALIAVILVFTLFSLIIPKSKENKKEKKALMSFKESIDLTNLPVVTFIFLNYEDNSEVKLNFLLDSGSTRSLINQSALLDNKVRHNVLFKTATSSGIEGQIISDLLQCSMKFWYKGHAYETVFVIRDLDITFNSIKGDTGVKVHGILGSDFFKKYKYVLDFKEMMAYMKV